MRCAAVHDSRKDEDDSKPLFFDSSGRYQTESQRAAVAVWAF